MWICFEDSQSAPRYFKEYFARERSVGFKRVQKKKSDTSPRQVIDAICRCKGQGTGTGDVYWAVIDADPQDGSHRKSLIDQALTEAKENGVQVAISNPAFEHWLRLHINDCDGACNDASSLLSKLKQEFETEFGSQFGKKTPAAYQKLASAERVAEACERARRQHNSKANSATADGPHHCQPCVTDVYRLIEAAKKAGEEAKR